MEKLSENKNKSLLGRVSWKKWQLHIRRKAKGIKNNIFVCQNCGKAYIRWRRNGEEGKKYCSRDCYFQKKHKKKMSNKQPEQSKIYIKKCTQCGKLFTSKTKKQRCSRDCDLEYAREKAYLHGQSKHKPKEITCKECGKVFITEYGDKKRYFCSIDCSSKYSRRKRKKELGNHRRRARYYGCEYEPINVVKVFERDGWRCQICGKMTPKNKKGKNLSNSPELDHIMPISLGGSHSYKNVQCACRSCNLKKGANPFIGNQMPMFPTMSVDTENARC